MSDIPLVNALLFAVLGLLLFLAAFAAVRKLFPFDLWKEVVQERNVAAAIVAGAAILGLSWIIAATLH
jgi:putative membrane protein